MAARTKGETAGRERTGRTKGSKPRSARPATSPDARPDAGLWLVATPIGNLADITLRALRILAAADIVACEDRRVTGRLLKAHGLTVQLTAYHDHNAERVRPALMRRLEGGEIVALVSDAGTPLISDPGYKLVREAAAAGIPVWSAPGPSATLAALAVSALPSDRFMFAGFLPTKSAARRAALATLQTVPGTLVFFESANRLAASLTDMAAVLGPRGAAVTRELTKLYEEVRRGSLDELAAHYTDAGAPRGEVAIVVAGPAQASATVDEAELDRQLHAALASASLRDAAADVAAATGLPKRHVYARALALSGNKQA